MEKIKMDITRKTLEEVGISPDYIVHCIAMMNPVDVKPEYIKGYLLLHPERQTLVSS